MGSNSDNEKHGQSQIGTLTESFKATHLGLVERLYEKLGRYYAGVRLTTLLYDVNTAVRGFLKISFEAFHVCYFAFRVVNQKQPEFVGRVLCQVCRQPKTKSPRKLLTYKG